jgi:arsenate reductase (glutaredoxin)
MKRLKIYEYGKCDTCRKALRFLEKRRVEIDQVDITITPPSIKELQAMLTHVKEVRKLFNTSGLVYKEMKLAEKLPRMSEEEALSLLATNGRLVKRPFLLGDGWGFVGFREDDWKKRI